MTLATLYDLTYYRSLRSKEKLADNVCSVASHADEAGSVIHLKLHFKEWLEVNSQIEKFEPRQKTVGS